MFIDASTCSSPDWGRPPFRAAFFLTLTFASISHAIQTFARIPAFLPCSNGIPIEFAELILSQWEAGAASGTNPAALHNLCP
jgi:hypothetical protein